MATVPPTIPRGIRNNNPGNVRNDPNVQWWGQTGVDPDGFCTMIDAAHGLRMILVIFNTYEVLHNLTTLSEWIYRWAPPVENDTADYVRFMAGRLSVAPDSPITVRQYWGPLLHGITAYENGQDPYTAETLQQARSLWLKR